jgi:hypothetical protein
MFVTLYSDLVQIEYKELVNTFTLTALDESHYVAEANEIVLNNDDTVTLFNDRGDSVIIDNYAIAKIKNTGPRKE